VEFLHVVIHSSPAFLSLFFCFYLLAKELNMFKSIFFSAIQIAYFLALLGIFPNHPHLLHDLTFATP